VKSILLPGLGLPGSFVFVRAAQELPGNITKEDLAKDNKLLLTLASKTLKREEPTEPVKIAGTDSLKRLAIPRFCAYSHGRHRRSSHDQDGRKGAS
jgi:hypothetical protein